MWPESGTRCWSTASISRWFDLTWPAGARLGVVLQEERAVQPLDFARNIALAESDRCPDGGASSRRPSLAGAHDFILELPEGYDTVVGERGRHPVGAGQRPTCRDRTARLITDPRHPHPRRRPPARSITEREAKRAIQQNMKRIAAGRTVFVIAHRLSTVRNANRIITLEAWPHRRGRQTMMRLIRSNGRYANLHYLQAGVSMDRPPSRKHRPVSENPGSGLAAREQEIGIPAGGARDPLKRPPSPIRARGDRREHQSAGLLLRGGVGRRSAAG